MKNLSIDIESYSDVNLAKSGVYRYAESDNFEILLFGYAVDGGEVRVVDTACGEKIPQEIIDALTDESVTKWAYNSMFERICLSKYIGLPQGEYISPESWKCSMIWSAYMGLPLSLKGVGAVLGLEKQKMSEGADLIKYFCIPCSPTKTNGGRTRNLPENDMEKWELFKAYNLRDVETEMQIQKKLSKFPVPDFVWEEYHQDQEINDRGIALDMTLVKQAIDMDTHSKQRLMSLMRNITQLENPNSVQQMKQWLSDNGLKMDSLGKKEVAQTLETAPKELAEVLMLRQQLAKSSVKKYTAMENAVCKDNRARGMFQFYGANRSGRFSGRNIQIQNLPQNHIPDLTLARNLVRSGDIEMLGLMYESVPDILSQLIRTAFIPRTGMKFIVADFSAIEARVIAWLAGEQWRLDVFENGGDIYCASASKMFGVPVEKHGVNGHLRQKGKISELACIAEDSMVLTDKGLIPIQNITTDHLLWDGWNWVGHEGLICRGIKEVITCGDLTATKDHKVYVMGETQPVDFLYAIDHHMKLIQTGKGKSALPIGNKTFNTSRGITGVKKVKVYDIQNAGVNHRFTVSNMLVHNCGYGGSVGALKAMGAVDMGIPENELQGLINDWRTANPHITKLWWDVDKAAKKVIKEKTYTETHGLKFTYQSGMLFITLPSGRSLSYVKPRMGENKFGGESITYEGVGGTKKWERIESYGPKIVENIVQGIARDILCYVMQTLRNCAIVAHVHDEVIIEADKRMSLEAVCEQMGRTPPWAEGLVLCADGYECEYYKKD